MKRIYRGWLFLLVLALMLPGMRALAGQTEAKLVPVPAENAYGSVTYPKLEGYANTAAQDDVNRVIYDKAQVENRLNTLNKLTEGGWGLTVNYVGSLQSDVLSAAVSAYGEMANGRMGQEYATVNYDLLNSRQIVLEDLFTDVEGAFSYMEQMVEEQVQPGLSGYMENDTLTPIPRDNFYLTPDGITFYYPQDQFSMLSGYSGGCSFFYYELKDYLQLSPGSVLDRLGAGRYLSIGGDTAQKVQEAAAAGRLPGIGANLGDKLMDRLNEYRLLVEPDYYPGGRFFETEAPQMRSIWLLTDALTEEYEQNQVLGIRADRVNLFGIQPGYTTLAEWRAALGEPQSTTDLDESTAGDFRLEPGTSDYYAYGENQLLLHADMDGVLQSVQLIR